MMKIAKGVLVAMLAALTLASSGSATKVSADTMTITELSLGACSGADMALAIMSPPAHASVTVKIVQTPCCFYSNCPSCGGPGQGVCCDGACNCVCVAQCCAAHACNIT
jgi:hypothetical protein